MGNVGNLDHAARLGLGEAEEYLDLGRLLLAAFGGRGGRGIGMKAGWTLHVREDGFEEGRLIRRFALSLTHLIM